jgi:hypothetical protein
MIFRIVVESHRDAAVYSALIRRVRNDVEEVLSRPCGGVSGVRKKFPGFLKEFQWHANRRVDKALIVRDSDCGDPHSAEQALADILQRSGFTPTFPCHFYATKCEVETWLLADEAAVNRVASKRGRTARARRVVGPLEGIRDAKEHFGRMLSEADLLADDAVYSEVAAQASIERIAQCCSGFQRFIHFVRKC